MGPEAPSAANDPGLGRDIRAQDTIPCPSPSLGSKLLIAFFVCASGTPFLFPPLLLFLPLLHISVPFFFRWSRCLHNLIKFISHSLLVFTFKTTAAISGPKKGLLPKSLSVFFFSSVAAGLIKDSPSFYKPQ